MEYIIGAILAIIVIITIALILRRRLYKAVDYYEAWKLEIMNENVAAELSKMKELNMKGATKEDFERWKEEWDTILTDDLATVEELLYDTEKAADKYNFPTAKKLMKEMEGLLKAADEKVEKVTEDIHALLRTEEQNREAMETLQPQLQELRKFLSQNRYKFNKADERYEKQFDGVQEKINTYEELIEEGHYIDATKLVEQIEQDITAITAEMDEFPALYKKCKQEIPAQLDTLTNGINEMIEAEYSFNQTELLVEIGHFQSRIIEAVETLENDGTESVKPLVKEIEEREKEIYDKLEDEALARNFIEQKMPDYEKELTTFENVFDDTKQEVEQLKQAYHFEESELERYHTLEGQLKDVRQTLETLTEKVAENKEAHSALRTELENAFQNLEQIELDHDTFKKSIDNLRKDELEARNELQNMHDQVNQINRQLRNSNLPGVPNFIWQLMDQTKGKNQVVIEALEKEPIDIIEVQQALSDAKASIEQVLDNTNKTLEQAFLTEQVIQYANRYRSSYPELAAKLKESERLFHKAEYELALENAARAVEEIEPGALKRIEKHQEQLV